MEMSQKKIQFVCFFQGHLIFLRKLSWALVVVSSIRQPRAVSNGLLKLTTFLSLPPNANAVFFSQGTHKAHAIFPISDV